MADKPAIIASTVEQPPRTLLERLRHHHGDTIEGYLFLSPFLIMYGVFLVYPMLKGFYISLHDWELVGFYREWTGLANYTRMFSDANFWRALWNTCYFVLLTVPVTAVVALALALALNKPYRTHAVFRAVFFSSSIVSVTVVTLIWQMVLSPDRGILAQALGAFGIPPINWLTDVDLAMPALAITSVWWGLGLPMMLFIAGLQQIPGDIYEAAKLDNAGRWAVLWHITLPALKRTTLLVVIVETILHFQMFGQAFLMTKGGPSGTTRSLVQYIYESGFRDWQLGYASAISMILFAIMCAASLLQLKVSRQED